MKYLVTYESSSKYTDATRRNTAVFEGSIDKIWEQLKTRYKDRDGDVIILNSELIVEE